MAELFQSRFNPEQGLLALALQADRYGELESGPCWRHLSVHACLATDNSGLIGSAHEGISASARAQGRLPVSPELSRGSSSGATFSRDWDSFRLFPAQQRLPVPTSVARASKGNRLPLLGHFNDAVLPLMAILAPETQLLSRAWTTSPGGSAATDDWAVR
jgi:hypothetical protein